MRWSCASTARTCTSATTSATYAAHAPPGARSVAVASGPCSAEELRAAGADVVLTDLTGFPEWLAGYRDGAGPDAARA